MMSTSEYHLMIPDELTSSKAKLVYVSLCTAEKATLTELHRQLGLSKLTLLSILDSLRQRDLITQTEDGYARC